MSLASACANRRRGRRSPDSAAVFIRSTRLRFQGANVNREILSLPHAHVQKQTQEGRGEGRERVAVVAKPESDLLGKSDLGGQPAIHPGVVAGGEGPSEGGPTEREQAGTKGRTG